MGPCYANLFQENVFVVLKRLFNRHYIYNNTISKICIDETFFFIFLVPTVAFHISLSLCGCF